MVEKRRDSSDSSEEDVSDEEFDLQALLRAPAFLSDDETENEAEPPEPESNDKDIILELRPIASIIEEEEKKCISKELHSGFGDSNKPDEQEPKYINSQLPHRMGAIRRRILALGSSRILQEERTESDYTVNYARRLQAVLQRINDVRSPDAEENSSLDGTGMSSPSLSHSHRLRTPPASPVLTPRTPAQIDISIPDWSRDNDDVLLFGQLDDSRDNRDEQNPVLICGAFGYKSDDSELQKIVKNKVVQEKGTHFLFEMENWNCNTNLHFLEWQYIGC